MDLLLQNFRHVQLALSLSSGLPFLWGGMVNPCVKREKNYPQWRTGNEQIFPSCESVLVPRGRPPPPPLPRHSLHNSVQFFVDTIDAAFATIEYHDCRFSFCNYRFILHGLVLLCVPCFQSCDGRQLNIMTVCSEGRF